MVTRALHPHQSAADLDPSVRRAKDEDHVDIHGSWHVLSRIAANVRNLRGLLAAAADQPSHDACSQTDAEASPLLAGIKHGLARSRPDPARRSVAESVLVVDDDTKIMRLVRDALVEAGNAPIVTGDHRERTRIVYAKRPAPVLLHLVLPDADGIDPMRGSSGLAFQPVTFISSCGCRSRARQNASSRLSHRRTRGADRGGAASACRSGAVRAGLACQRMRQVSGERCRTGGRTHAHRNHLDV